MNGHSNFRFDLARTFSAHVFGPIFWVLNPPLSNPRSRKHHGKPTLSPTDLQLSQLPRALPTLPFHAEKLVKCDQQGLGCWGCWGYAKTHGFTWKFHSGTFRYLSDSWTTSAMNYIAISVAICWLDPAQHVAVICGVSFLLLSPC